MAGEHVGSDRQIAVTGRYRLIAVEELPGAVVMVRLQDLKTGDMSTVTAAELAHNKTLLYGMLPESTHEAAHTSGVLTGKIQLFPLISRLENVLALHSGRLRFVVIGSFTAGVALTILLLALLARF